MKRGMGVCGGMGQGREEIGKKETVWGRIVAAMAAGGYSLASSQLWDCAL